MANRELQMTDGSYSRRLTCIAVHRQSRHFASTFDLVITDPPFGDNIFYSDLSNFFYAWLVFR